MNFIKKENGFEVSRYSTNGFVLYKEFANDTTLEDAWNQVSEMKDEIELAKENFEKIQQENEEIKRQKEKEKEKIKELEEENKALTQKKNDLLEKWASDKNPAILIEHKDEFPRPYDSLQIIKGHHYNYAGTLYQAKSTFKYYNQKSPLLEPNLWYRVGDPVSKPTDLKAEYEAKFKKAVDWYSDKSYVKTDLVRYYNKLYELVAEKSSGHNPEKEPTIWKLIPKPE